MHIEHMRSSRYKLIIVINLHGQYNAVSHRYWVSDQRGECLGEMSGEMSYGSKLMTPTALQPGLSNNTFQVSTLLFRAQVYVAYGSLASFTRFNNRNVRTLGLTHFEKLSKCS